MFKFRSQKVIIMRRIRDFVLKNNAWRGGFHVIRLLNNGYNCFELQRET